MIPFWLFVLVAGLLSVSVVLNIVLLRECDRSEKIICEEREGRWAALGRVVELEARLEPFKGLDR